MSDEDPLADRLVIPVPPEYDDEQTDAYRTGFVACAQLFRGAATTYVEALTTADGLEADEDPETCRECGAPTLPSMGADETDYSPAGRTCPDCEL